MSTSTRSKDIASCKLPFQFISFSFLNTLCNLAMHFQALTCGAVYEFIVFRQFFQGMLYQPKVWWLTRANFL